MVVLVVWHVVAWCGVVWRGVAWCEVVWCHVVWCGAMRVVSCGGRMHVVSCIVGATRLPEPVPRAGFNRRLAWGSEGDRDCLAAGSCGQPP